MSQNDFNIANQGFPQFRADMNSAFQALASNSSGATAPATTYAYQFWYDTTNNLLKMRNGANSNWITLARFDQATNEWEVRTAVVQAVDSAGVVIKTDDGTTRLTVADDGTVTLANDLVVTGDIWAATINGITPAIATQAEAEAGTDNTTLMTPLRVEQHMTANLATQAQAQAGTDNTKLMTPLRTAQAALGRGQTWQSVTRSVNTVYQNTLSKPIVVSYTGTSAAAAGSALGIRIEVGPANPPTLVVNSATAFGLSSTATVSAIVPPNHYYRFSDPVIFLTPIGPKTFVELI